MLYMVVREYQNRAAFRSARHLMYADATYHPHVTLLLGRLAASINHVLLAAAGFRALGDGLYSQDALAPGETVLLVGGFLSPNLSVLYVHSMVRWARAAMRGKACRVFVYNPPECTYGTSYDDTHLLARATVSSHAERLVSVLRYHAVDVGSLHIIAHSYGTMLGGYVRRAVPCTDATITHLIDPIPAIPDAGFVARVLRGTVPFNHTVPRYGRILWVLRQHALSYIIRYPFFFQLGAQVRRSDGIDGCIRGGGKVVAFVAAHDDLVDFSGPVSSRGHVVMVPGHIHGTMVFSHMPALRPCAG